jgi:hypothetical protein
LKIGEGGALDSRWMRLRIDENYTLALLNICRCGSVAVGFCRLNYD